MEQLPLTIKDPVERYAICKGCDKFFAPTRQCAECMCTMNAKVKFEDATCPLGKW
jgi:hypothetical protein